MLGGNSSSEIRVTPHGAGRHHPYAAETGIVSEAILAERLRCHVKPMENSWTNSQWDMALYDLAVRTPNLTLHLNTPLTDVLLEDGTRGSTLDPKDERVQAERGYYERPAINPARRISSIECRVNNAEVLLTLHGKQFVDCTGDGLVAHLAGCNWRMGTEAASDFNEVHAPSVADTFTMGSSLQFHCHDAGRPVPFTPPPWAKKLDDPEFFWGKGGRVPHNPRGGFWWIEIGIPHHTIFDNEKIREELTAYVFGVWDWMKNKDAWMKEKCANYVLDWVGQVPGKRESRRIMGRHFINENELKLWHCFPDEIAHGGWFLDLHTPGGLLAENSEPTAAVGYSDKSIERAKGHIGPYGLPLRILQSADIDNLGMAGRDISSSKAALGSIRVMQTCAVMGQAIGTAAAQAIATDRDLCLLKEDDVRRVQLHLQRDGAFMPTAAIDDPLDLIKQGGRISATSEEFLERTPVLRASSDQPVQTGLHKQDLDLAQAIPVHGERLESLSICLNLNWPGPVEVPLTLRHVRSIWDYDQDEGTILAQGTVTARPGQAQWCEWSLGIDLPESLRSGGYLRLEMQIDHPGKLTWEPATQAVMGCPAYFLMPCTNPDRRGERYRRHSESPATTFSFALNPSMPVYSPDLILRPANRPHTDTGMWRSDPQSALPQSVTCQWDSPKSVRQIELHFPGDLARELSFNPPLSTDPEIARDYAIEGLRPDGTWQTLCEVEGNYQLHRLHCLEQNIDLSALRLTIRATNGSPSASLSNLRAYSEPGDYPDPWGM